jgi:hypothetical protein
MPQLKTRFSCHVYAAELKNKPDEELHDERKRVNYIRREKRREGTEKL